MKQRIEELEAALRPFAAYGTACSVGMMEGAADFMTLAECEVATGMALTLGRCREAARVLAAPSVSAKTPLPQGSFVYLPVRQRWLNMDHVALVNDASETSGAMIVVVNSVGTLLMDDEDTAVVKAYLKRFACPNL